MGGLFRLSPRPQDTRAGWTAPSTVPEHAQGSSESFSRLGRCCHASVTPIMLLWFAFEPEFQYSRGNYRLLPIAGCRREGHAHLSSASGSQDTGEKGLPLSLRRQHAETPAAWALPSEV